MLYITIAITIMTTGHSWKRKFHLCNSFAFMHGLSQLAAAIPNPGFVFHVCVEWSGSGAAKCWHCQGSSSGCCCVRKCGHRRLSQCTTCSGGGGAVAGAVAQEAVESNFGVLKKKARFLSETAQQRSTVQTKSNLVINLSATLLWSLQSIIL